MVIDGYLMVIDVCRYIPSVQRTTPLPLEGPVWRDRSLQTYTVLSVGGCVRYICHNHTFQCATPTLPLYSKVKRCIIDGEMVGWDPVTGSYV